jgi:hypothetical protein
MLESCVLCKKCGESGMSLRVNKRVEFTVELELQCEYSAHSSLSYVESHLIKDMASDNIFL